LQADEIWSFCYAKQKNVPADKRGEFGYGDVWTWVAMDSDTKLVPTFHIGPRDLREATTFMTDLAGRLKNRVQLTTDGLSVYLLAVEGAFKGDVDYAQLVKVYGSDRSNKPERRYSPAVCLDAIPHPVNGSPNGEHISTSHVERLNLTMRMSMRRFTRLTNAFSKKIENLAAAVSLHFAYYNFCRVHQTLGTTPAVAAGVTDHVWKLDELIGLLEAAEATTTKRGRYAKTREISK
jgi:IS1 family transposase